MKRFGLLAAALAMALPFVATTRVCAQSASDVKDELDAYKDDVNSGIGTLSSRIADLENQAKLKFKGDFRLRYEYFTQHQDNSPYPDVAPTANQKIANRSRYRIRLRFGAEKQFGDEVYTAFRLATGGTTEPTSTNQTLTGQAVEKGVYIDQAYLKYTPACLGSRVDLYGGKMANILDATAITWDGDVTPEGLAAAVRLPESFGLKGHYFLLNEDSSKTDPYLYNVQLTKDLQVAGQSFHLMAGYEFVPWVSGMLATVPANFNSASRPRPTINSPFTVDGNGMVANQTPGSKQGWIPDIKMIEGLVSFKHKLAGCPIAWTFHVARNTNSFDLNKTTTAGKIKAGSLRNADAFFAKVELGSSKVKGDTKVALQWGYIEPNAVLSLFSDSDSGQGYNNQKWVKADLGYMLTDALALNFGQYAAKRVNYDLNGATVSTSFEKTSRSPEYRSQLDFVVKL